MTKITIDRATVEQALEALEIEASGWEDPPPITREAITALRQALQQPNEFNPDWDQIKPFHDRIAELESVAKQALGAIEGVVHAHGYKGGTPVEAITTLRQALEQPTSLFSEGEAGVFTEFVKQKPMDHAVIAGALFDFLGWLTSRQQRVTWSSCDDATTAVDAVIEFAKMRGLSLDEVHVLNWQDRIQAKQAQQEPAIDKSAATRIATALGWGPKKEWVGLTDEEIGTLANEHLDVGDGICGRNFVIGEIEFARATEAKLKGKNT